MITLIYTKLQSNLDRVRG